MRAAQIILWSNGLVMAFGDDDKQIPDVQGDFRSALQKALAISDDNTTFAIGSWEYGTLPCSRAQIENFVGEGPK